MTNWLKVKKFITDNIYYIVACEIGLNALNLYLNGNELKFFKCDECGEKIDSVEEVYVHAHKHIKGEIKK